MERDPLEAVPVASPFARVEPRSSGPGAVLVLGGPAPTAPFARFFSRLGFRRERRFELDTLGERYWSSIDGVRSLAHIQQRLIAEHGLTPALARRSVIEFTATLMRRGLIGLETNRDG